MVEGIVALIVLAVIYKIVQVRKYKAYRKRMKAKIEKMRQDNIPGAETLWKSFHFDTEE